MNKIVSEVRDELIHNILPFWKKLKDDENGGYYSEVEYSLQINKEAPKSSLSHARILLAFSLVYNQGLDDESIIYARHAYNFLIEKCLDQEYGGLFYMTDFKGNVLSSIKHTYVQAFFIYALTQYFIATNDQSVVQLAMKQFYLIENKMFDPIKNGYLEEFDNSFRLKQNEITSEHGITAYFTMNTHLHVLEAYTELVHVTNDDTVKAKLMNLILIFSNKLFDKTYFKVFLDETFSSILNTKSYGHDIEATWLIDRAISTLGLSDTAYFEKYLKPIVENCTSFINQDGSMILEEINGISNPNRVWWVQAEAIIGFYNAYQKTQDRYYKEISLKLWQYIKDNMIDPRDDSEWFWQVSDKNEPIKDNLSEIWKTPYHNVRFCIEMINRLS